MNELEVVLGRQHGAITHAQALAAGLSRHAVTHRLRRGSWVRRHRGCYVLAACLADRHSLLSAALLYAGALAVAFGFTAAELHGLEPARRRWFCIVVPVERYVSPSPGVCLHRTRSLTDADRREVAGLATTGLERTVLDLCGQIRSETDRLALVARILQAGRSTPPRLAACVARSPSVAGAARLSDVLRTLEPGYESGVEAELGHHLARAGLRPIAQHPLQLPSGRRIRVDLAFLAEGVAVEVDGAAFHLGPAQREADLTRDEQLRALGWEVVRVTARQMREEPALVVSRVIAVLRRRHNAAGLPA